MHVHRTEAFPINILIWRAGLAAFALCLLLSLRAAFADTTPPAALPPPDPAFYAYDQTSPLQVTEKPFGEENGVKISVLTYPSPVTTPYPVNNLVTAYLFMPPDPGPHPAMVVLHEWNAGSTKGGFELSRVLARANVAALFVEEPFSLARKVQNPRPGEGEILSGNVLDMRANLRQAVLDARRGLDYLAQRPDIDSKRLGVSGISLGGVLSGVVAGVDPRVKVIMTLVGGADFAHGFWNGLLTRRYRREILRRGYTFETFRDAMAPIEASRWLHDFNPHNALMINGRYDLVILPKQAQKLSHALGDTPIVWGNTGHYGMSLSIAQAGEVGYHFLRSRFFGDDPTYAPPSTLPNTKTIKLGLLLGGHEGVSPAVAYQVLNFDPAGRYSIDGQLTLHGLSAALSARLGITTSIGLEFPLLHGKSRPRPFFLFHLVL